MDAESAERRAAPLKTSPFFAALGGALGLLWGGAAKQETSATNPPPHLTHVHFLFSVSLVFIFSFSFSISLFGVTMVIVAWGGAAEQETSATNSHFSPEKHCFWANFQQIFS